jgi:hypothetical protein
MGKKKIQRVHVTVLPSEEEKAAALAVSKMTPAEIAAAAHEYHLQQARELLKEHGYVQGPGDTWTPAEMGKLGGKARAKNLSKKKLSEIGKQGAAKRWAKPGEKGGK